jgi:hypothetical protein
MRDIVVLPAGLGCVPLPPASTIPLSMPARPARIPSTNSQFFIYFFMA